MVQCSHIFKWCSVPSAIYDLCFLLSRNKKWFLELITNLATGRSSNTNRTGNDRMVWKQLISRVEHPSKWVHSLCFFYSSHLHFIWLVHLHHISKCSLVSNMLLVLILLHRRNHLSRKHHLTSWILSYNRWGSEVRIVLLILLIPEHLLLLLLVKSVYIVWIFN